MVSRSTAKLKPDECGMRDPGEECHSFRDKVTAERERV